MSSLQETFILKELSIFGGRGKTRVELEAYITELDHVGEPAFTCAILKCANNRERGSYAPSVVELRSYMESVHTPRNPSPAWYSVDGQYGGKWPDRRGNAECRAVAESVWSHPDDFGKHSEKQAVFVRFLGFEPAELEHVVA